MDTDKIYQREMARRKSLWELARYKTGDPLASGILDVLDAIDVQESDDSYLPGQAISIDEVASSIAEELLPSGVRMVREAGISQPWLERFRCASIGSTRLAEGPYAADWENFVRKWQAEMLHLEEHRSVRAKRG